MSGANVEDIDIFRALKVALIKFRQTADTALLNADSQIMRTLSWLENEQISHWNAQIRKRTENVSRCVEALRAKTIFKDSTGRTPDASREQKMLKLAQAQLVEAEMRLSSTKKAIPKLQKELENYRGAVAGLGSNLISEIPKALAMIERMTLSLEEYVNASMGSLEPGATLPSDEEISTGEQSGAAEASTAEKPEVKEGGENVPG